MSKQKTSMKNIVNRYNKVFYMGYCDLQYIMKYEEPMYYNCGVYGWNCDIYVDFEYDIAITTGYRNMRGVRIPSDIYNKYNDKAKEILQNMWKIPYDELKEKMDKNVNEFYKELNEL